MDAVIDNQDYSLLQRELKVKKDDLGYLKLFVELIFLRVSFKGFLDIVDKIKFINIKFHSAIKPQTLRVLKHALKSDLNFNLKLIFQPDILYLQQPGSDIESHNKLMFEHIKPLIKSLASETNIFTISKLISLSFNFNKSFEFRVQYYYLEGLIKNFIADKHCK